MLRALRFLLSALRFQIPSTLLLLVLSVLSGCGGDGARPTTDAGQVGPDADLADGGGDDRTFLELCYQPERYCERLYACATADRLAEDQLFFGHEDEPGCVEAQHRLTGVLCAQLGSSVDAGRLGADLGRLAACVDYMEALSCHSYVHDEPESHEPCRGSPFLTPLVGRGGECAFDGECKDDGSLCTGELGDLGECVEAPAEGEPCVADRCGEGLVCEEGTCVVPDPGACHYDFDCADGEWCDQPGNDFREEFLDPELTGICTARLTLGQNCEDVQACLEGLYCDDTSGQDAEGFRLPGHCAEPRPAGAECNEPADCASFECDPFTEVCD